MTTHTITSLTDLRALYDTARERSRLKELPALDAHALRYLSLSPFVVVASYGASGQADASPRGGEPGFVKVVDGNTLLIPDSPGNNRLDTLENIIATGHVGLCFMLPGIDETLRVNGRAVLSTNPADCARCTDARRTPKLVIRVAVEAAYMHCAKAFMRSDLWNPAKHQPTDAMPSMGEMLRDQVAARASPGTTFETREEMLARYRQTL